MALKFHYLIPAHLFSCNQANCNQPYIAVNGQDDRSRITEDNFVIENTCEHDVPYDIIDDVRKYFIRVLRKDCGK